MINLKETGVNIMLNTSGILKCIKEVIMKNGNRVFTEGKEYRYWKGTYHHSCYNDMKQPHIIYNEREGDVDNFLLEHFEIIK